MDKQMKIIIVKIVSTIPQGRFGVMMTEDRVPFAVTLERTFDGPDNTQVCIIPFGISHCHRDFYNKGGYPTFEIEVPGHVRVLLHKLNLEIQSQACMGIGEQFGVLDGQPAILQSGSGFDEFMGKLKGVDEFNLIVEP
jgi:hypothetical protein